MDAAFHAETDTSVPHRTARQSRNAEQIILGDSRIHREHPIPHKDDSTRLQLHTLESLGYAVQSTSHAMGSWGTE